MIPCGAAGVARSKKPRTIRNVSPRLRETALVVLLIFAAAAATSLVGAYHYTSASLEEKAREIEDYFLANPVFSQAAQQLVRQRPDIIYVSLIDSNGVVRQSYGVKNRPDMKKFTFPYHNDHTVVLGLRKSSLSEHIKKPLLYSLLVSAAITILFLVLRSTAYIDSALPLMKAARAMRSIAGGDYGVTLDENEVASQGTEVKDLYRSFNLMRDQLARRLEKAAASPKQAASPFEPQVIQTPQETMGEKRRIVTFVNRISNVDEVEEGGDRERFDQFLKSFREEATSIINKYGGTLEAVFQSEIVAFFNAPRQLDKPELRAVCAGVEILQRLAQMNKDAQLGAAKAVSGRVGIDAREVPFNRDTGMPHNVKELLRAARRISNSMTSWKVMVSPSVYEAVKDYVDVKEYSFDEGKVYSITAVEEGVVEV